ncbi:EAL domain-containing protein [Moritella sp. F3]|uniref:EAL domain-containing protein n=1 Tax=Moritella sp. F3 TaxID=2718882 RepID=UPI0018E13198|nr:EAL domain-containing protein [Moritella sp. F3]GIC75315.1 diguanylate phosphodiesterase [Moritella sp. F1]GIC80460.1 diguanylate phosphodiesterase [Moritella sp. F3]
MDFMNDYAKLHQNIVDLIKQDNEYGFSITDKGLTFTSVFQPIFDREHNIYGVEALARIFDSDGATINPHDYFESIRHDDESSAIATLTCAIIHMLNFSYSCHYDKKLFINVTPVIFEILSNHDIAVDTLVRGLKKIGLSPAQLVYEIIEFEGRNLESVLNGIQKLAGFGIEVAIDDYGSAYSTEERVRSVRPDYLKIDKSIVDLLAAFKYNKFHHAVSLGHLIKAKTIAEGIETEAVFERCVASGADYFQGYYLAKPQRLERLASVARPHK